MITDIIKTTKYITERLINSKLRVSSPMYVYDSYRLLREVINNLNCLAVHYIAKRFDHENLQNSGFGKPENKWRFFVNKDLDRLNESVTKYFLSLTGIGVEDQFNEQDEGGLFFEDMKVYKTYCAMITSHYSVGHIENDSTTIKTVQFIILDDRKENIPIEEFLKFNFKLYKEFELDTYKKRVDFSNLLFSRKDELIDELFKLNKYITENFTLEDLLEDRFIPDFLKKGNKVKF